MKDYEVIRYHGDLKREVWRFFLYSYHPREEGIYLESYFFQEKDSPRRRKWSNQTQWNRFYRRENNITSPPIPPDVEKEVREYYKNLIDTLPIEID